MVEIENKDFDVMITELHMASRVVSNDWWLDSGAIIHVCNTKSMFNVYKELKEPQEVLMGNCVTAKVLSKGSVALNFTYGKPSFLRMFSMH